MDAAAKPGGPLIGRRWGREPVKLPALPGALDKMSRFDLEHLVSELCQRDFSNGSFLGKIVSRPTWWPSNVDFHSTVDVIRNCYEYYNQEQLLRGPTVRDSPRSLRRAAQKNAKSSKSSSFTRDKVLAESGKPNQENKNPQYVGQRVAMPYTASLPDHGYGGPSLPHTTKTSNSSPPTGQTPGMLVEPALVEIFICFFCEKEFGGRSELTAHQLVCSKRPPELQMLAANSNGQHTKSKARRQLYPTQTSPKAASVSKSDYIAALGLLTKQEAVTLQRRDSSTGEIDCEIVMVEEPVQPTTPRTPKSLISQLSRDASPPPCMPGGWGEKPFSKDLESSDSEESVDEKDERRPGHRSQKLYNIDVTSTLGQRLKKQFAALSSGSGFEAGGQSWWEKHINYEAFCTTPTKAEPLEKLRNRNTYGYHVSFRTKKKMPKYVHKYHFNQRQRRARHLVLLTGLSQRSRCLKKQMPKCSVRLNRLKPDFIERMTARRKSMVRLPAHMFQPSPVVVNSEQLRKLLNMKLPDSQMRSYNVSMLPSASQTSQTKYFSLSPKSQLAIADTSPTYVTQEPNAHDQRLSSLLQSMLENNTYVSDTRQKQTPTTIQPDPISISSDSDDEASSSNKHSAACEPPAAKRARVADTGSLALLFRCHLCKEELRCKHNMRQVIQHHYGKQHNVHNIDLIEHTDRHGNQVISIVEMQKVKRSEPKQPKQMNKPTTVVDLTDDDDDVMITGETPPKIALAPSHPAPVSQLQAALAMGRKSSPVVSGCGKKSVGVASKRPAPQPVINKTPTNAVRHTDDKTKKVNKNRQTKS